MTSELTAPPATTEPGWTFTATVADPLGATATTTVYLPISRANDRTVPDAAELAKIAALSTVKRIREAIEEVPF